MQLPPGLSSDVTSFAPIGFVTAENKTGVSSPNDATALFKADALGVATPYKRSLLGAKVEAIDVFVAPSALGLEIVISILSLISDAFKVSTKPSVAF